MPLPISDHLVNYIENWLKLGEQLINQQEKINSNTLSDNNHLLSQIKECEDEINRLKNLLEHITTDKVIYSLVNQLTAVRVTLIFLFILLLL
jgi:predicted PurR-regulated permease PerM